MKKLVKRCSIVLIIALFLSMFQMNIFAGSGANPNDAIDITFGNTYTIYSKRFLSSDYATYEKFYVKLNVNSNGVVQLKIDKPIDKDGEYQQYLFTLYNYETNDLVWECHNSDAATDMKSYFQHSIGLKKGTYIMEMYPMVGFTDIGSCLNYKYTFKANSNYEIEPNDTKGQATKLTLNNFCSGVYGEGNNKNRSPKDIFSIRLEKGKKYRFFLYGIDKLEQSTCITEFRTPSDKELYIYCKTNSDGTAEYGDFTAPETGIYYFNMYNASQNPFEYKIGFFSTPSTPKLASISNETSGIKFSWNAVKGVSGYTVYRKSGSTSWKSIASVKADTTSYIDKSVKSGTKYSYTVIAKNNSLSSGYDKTGLSLMRISSPTLKYSNQGKDIKLSWNKITGAQYYKVQQSADGKFWTTLIITDKTSYVATNLKSGTSYKYRVSALDKTKKTASKYSSVLSAITLCKAPTIKLSSSKSKTATVTITKVTGASKYIIYKSTDGKKWTKVTTTTSTSYNLTKLTGGKRIYVKVQAANAAGKASAYSSAKYVTVKK